MVFNALIEVALVNGEYGPLLAELKKIGVPRVDENSPPRPSIKSPLLLALLIMPRSGGCRLFDWPVACVGSIFEDDEGVRALDEFSDVLVKLPPFINKLKSVSLMSGTGVGA